MENLRFVCGRFTELYYSSSGLPPHTLQPAVPAANEGPSELHIALNEWDYVPNVGSRPSGGYVGLKNAGATCYMNSVLQQVRHLSRASPHMFLVAFVFACTARKQQTQTHLFVRTRILPYI